MPCGMIGHAMYKRSPALSCAIHILLSIILLFIHDTHRTSSFIIPPTTNRKHLSFITKTSKITWIPSHPQRFGNFNVHLSPDNKDETDVAVTKNNGAKASNYNTVSINKRPRIISSTKEQVPRLNTADTGFNVVLTHCTADFDSLASAVGLAKLWSTENPISGSPSSSNETSTSRIYPTYVVLPRGCHPSVQKFLALHEHLFPIRSLRSLPPDVSKLNRLGLVDAQRRERVGPAEFLLSQAKRVTIVDHHVDGESDITEATDYIVDRVGSVSTMICEFLQKASIELSEAEATLLALGIHGDTGSLCYDSTTARDAKALAWVMEQGASQSAIAEHVRTSLSSEQQNVLTQALIYTNSTLIHGVTVSTVLLNAEGFINGLAAVTQDALELSSSDVFILCVVYDAKGNKGKAVDMSHAAGHTARLLQSRLTKFENVRQDQFQNSNSMTHAWKGGKDGMTKGKLRSIFDQHDRDGSGYLEREEVMSAIVVSGIITSKETIDSLITSIDQDGDGKIDFKEFFAVFENLANDERNKDEPSPRKRAKTMTVIGRAKAGVTMKTVNLNKLFSQYGGGGHAKAASCTIRLDDENDAGVVIQDLVNELIATSLTKQLTVGDFMTSPVLSAKPHMTERQVEDLFTRYDVRALPVVDDKNNVIGLVTYKEVAAAKQRLWNKEQRQMRSEKVTTDEEIDGDKKKAGSVLKGWMKQHVQTVEASMTMAEVENILLENDIGCIPVVATGTMQLVGLVTRTDLLRQHRYYPSLHYHNKGFSDSIAARKPIIELRKKLKQFDLDD